MEKIKNEILTNDENCKVLKYDIDGVETEVVVKLYLPFKQRIEMEQFMITFVFDDGYELNSYKPQYIEFAKRYGIMSYYTNLNLPEDIDELWEILYQNNIYDDVIKCIKDDMKLINFEIDEQIKFKRTAILNVGNFNLVIDKISKILNSVKKGLKGKDFKEILNSIKNLPKMSEQDIVDKILTSEKSDINKIK